MKFVLSMTCILTSVVLLACSGENDAGLPPQQVNVYQVDERDVPVYLDFVGQIYGRKDIAIRARVEGFLEGIHFSEGEPVKANQLLYMIESQPFEADVAAKMSKLAEAKTILAKNESDLNRYRPLAAKNAVSQSDLDAAVAQFEAAEANVEAAEANLRAARIQLSYTKVRSPINGMIGRTLARVGDFVGKSPNPVILNTVSQTDSVRVQFFITENQYLQFMRRILASLDDESNVEGTRDQRPLDLLLSDGSLYKHQGFVNFIDRGVDPSTGAILMEASFTNPDGLLRPGQFARIRAQADIVKNGIIIPQRCLMEVQGQHQVYVVGDNDEVELRNVVAGAKYYNFWLIEEGLEAGDRVIYEGLQKVRPGVSVTPELESVELITNTN